MVKKNLKKLSSKQDFKKSFDIGLSFFDSAKNNYENYGEELSSARMVPIIDDLFHGCEKIAFSFVCNETRLKIGEHGKILSEFNRLFLSEDKIGKELIKFYVKMKDLKDSLLYQFDVNISKKDLKEYINLSKRFEKRCTLYAISRKWL